MNKKGAAFLTTLILLGIAIMASSALSFMLLMDTYTVKRLKYSAEAYYLAEAGVEEAIQKLWDNDFEIDSFPINRNLGAGSIKVELDNSKFDNDAIRLIKSAGTVILGAMQIKRCVNVEVKYNRPAGLSYAVLANGKVFVTGGGVVNCNAGDGVHSNSPAKGGSFATAAVDVAGITAPSWVYGDASAVGNVKERLFGRITGAKHSAASAVSLPSFDAAFFSYYLNRAIEGGDVYEGSQLFTANLTPNSGVAYINGSVIIVSGIIITGCIVATGDIAIMSSSRVTQNQIDTLPALMSRGGSIWIFGPATLRGLIYAPGDIWIYQILSTNSIDMTGSIISQGNITIGASTTDVTTLNYIKQIPPGMGANPIGWILNWQEE